jgi:nucleoside-diphosphate-sugar epimerase
MRVLVTGGAGFIGSHLVDLLVSEGHEVTVLALPGENRANVEARPVTFVEGDVRDRAAVRSACAGAEVVFHLAARTDLAGRSLAEYDVNVAGTEAVLAACVAERVRRLVFFSSMLAVALTKRADPVDETFTGEPDSLYGRSKRAAEELVRASGVPHAILRPTLVYGPRERSTMYAFFRALRRRQFVLIGPDVLQSFVYVRNVAAAAYSAGTHPGAENGTFFVSDARPYALSEFAAKAAGALGVRLWPVRVPMTVGLAAGSACDAVARVIGRELPLSSRRVRTMTTPYVYSIDAARRAFGYDATWSLEAGVAETASYYLERSLL